jgi:hypothetical protein
LPSWSGCRSPDRGAATRDLHTQSRTPKPHNIFFENRDRRMANTTKIEDTQERKKIKRAARKKAAPKAKRTEPRGSNKQKIKKLGRGQSKR